MDIVGDSIMCLWLADHSATNACRNACNAALALHQAMNQAPPGDITALPMYQRARMGVGYLPQEASIFRKLTVEENIRAVATSAVREAANRQSFLDRVHAEFMQSALAFGQILMPNGSALPVAKLDKFSAHTFQGRRWEWVDPLKDIEADIAAINAGLKSPQSVAAKLGLDYEDLLVEIKAAETLRKTMGVVLASEQAALATAKGQAAAANGASA